MYWIFDILADLIGFPIVNLVLLGLLLYEPGHFTAHFTDFAVGLRSIVESVEGLGPFVHVVPTVHFRVGADDDMGFTHSDCLWENVDQFGVHSRAHRVAKLNLV
jgi:hypothetical protein